MPTALVKSLAQKSGLSSAKVENLWNKAKEIAASESRPSDFPYIVGLLKVILGLKENRLTRFLSNRYIKSSKKDFDEFIEDLISSDFPVTPEVPQSNKKRTDNEQPEPLEQADTNK